MGLTSSSTGINVADTSLFVNKKNENDYVIALAGNPNVGKSTVFNELTGMNQHTGNWPGKTVTNAQGYFETDSNSYVLVDIPGTYSLLAHSAEEEVARNFICFGNPDAVAVVCDATCLERNLNLVLQILEVTPNVIVCVNLMDEAKRKNININLPRLSEILGVPVIGTVAKDKKTLKAFGKVLDNKVSGRCGGSRLKQEYPETVKDAVKAVAEKLGNIKNDKSWTAIKLLSADDNFVREICDYNGLDISEGCDLHRAVKYAKATLEEKGIDGEKLGDIIASTIVTSAEKICSETVTFEKKEYNKSDRMIDKILTSKLTGYPIMLVALIFILWITITGANYPSEWLAAILSKAEYVLSNFLMFLKAPLWLHNLLVLGVFRTVSWIVAVMLPPMAIFFPLFTLLEDVGYLPRIAYNLDKPFKCCKACGKQALTMCMGFGCNAAGVIGCRIIDSPRERLLAILTNNFIPCNGRFPTLIAIITMFYIGAGSGLISTLKSAIMLAAVIIFGIIASFLATKLLSSTMLKGEPSSFTLELPPYRKPQIGQVIIRSVFDRTLFVLARAVTVAAPAGAIIWLMANIDVGGTSVLQICADFLDPFASIMGMDGIILMAFILGFPANETVIPIMIMAYLSNGYLTEYASLDSLKELLLQNGWSWVTAVSVMIFSLMHWPCSTTVLTIKKETGSLKWTALAVILPTLFGIAACILFKTATMLIN